MTRTTDLRLQWSLITRIGNLAITGTIPLPKSTLTAPITANNGTWMVHVTSVLSGGKPMFRPGQMLSFWDGLGNTGGSGYDWPTGPDYLPSAEELLVIDSVDTVANTITLDSNGVGYSGLQFAHQTGCYVLANLKPETQLVYQNALNSGFPVFAVAVYGQEDTHSLAGKGPATVRRWAPVFDVEIECARNLIAQPEGSIAPDLYANRQKAAIRADMNAIRDALMLSAPTGNAVELPINGNPQIINLGPRGPRSSERHWVISADTDQYSISLDVQVTGKSGGF